MGLIIIRSSHYLSMKPKEGAISNGILVELGTYILTFQPSIIFLPLVVPLTQTITHLHSLILKTHMPLKQKIHPQITFSTKKSRTPYLYPMLQSWKCIFFRELLVNIHSYVQHFKRCVLGGSVWSCARILRHYK